MMDIYESEFPDDTSPVDMDEGLNYRKDDKNEKDDYEKEVECPDDTSPVDVEDGVSDRKDDNNEKNDE